VRYLELPERPRYPDFPESFWNVAGTLAVNRTLEEARGDLIAPLDHDDAFTANHIPVLLDAMHRAGADFGYGTAMSEDQRGGWGLIGQTPLQIGRVVHASVMYTRRLAHMRYDGDAWVWGDPGDWNLWRRIRATGAGIAFSPHPVAVHFREQSSIAGKERQPAHAPDMVAQDLRRAGEGKLLTVASHSRGAALGGPDRSRPARLSRASRLAVVGRAFPPSESEPAFEEAAALLERRPDTVFFSENHSTESWPRPIYPLAELPDLIGPLGVTDVYATSLATAVRLVGLEKHPDAARLPDVAGAQLRVPRLRVHAEIEADARVSPALLKAVGGRAATTFTNSERMLAAAPKTVLVGRSVATDWYAFRARARRRPFQLLFAGAADGLDMALDAASRLDGDRFVLHVYGPYEDRLQRFPGLRAVIHASPTAEELRTLFWECHAVISAGSPSSHTAAAVASGSALVGTGMGVLEPGSQFLEACEPELIAAAVRRLEDDHDLRDRVAEQGAARVRAGLGAGAVLDAKLAAMQLVPEA
jgi:hypothetical protein